MPDKPRLEELIPDYLTGNMEKTALDFILYMRANKMPPAYRPSYCFKCSYKSKVICTIGLPSPQRNHYDNQFDQPWMPEGIRRKNYWVIFPELNHFSEYANLIFDEGFHDIIWNEKNIYFCNKCNGRDGSCSTNKSIFGREFKNLCGARSAFFWFFNPDETTIKCIKRLLELEQKARTKKL